jgi:hypothetical protein
MNDVHTRTIVCCYRGRVGIDLSGMLICSCFHVVDDVSMVSMAN